MILQIEFQHVIRTNEQNEIKPFEFKSIIRTSEGDQTDYWNIADPAPDFGCRQFVYVWFEHIPDNAIKEIEAVTPSPFISFWNNGWTEYRNFIKLSVLPDSAVQESQLKEARQLSKQLDLKYQNWQKELAETQTAASPKIFPFQIYQYVSELVEVKSILEQSPKSSPTSEQIKNDSTVKTGQKPRKKRTTVTKQKIEQAIKIVARCPGIYNYEVCTLIGVDENCAGNNPDGRPKALRLAIDRTREANANGGCYITGDRDIKKARDSFYNDYHIDDDYDNE